MFLVVSVMLAEADAQTAVKKFLLLVFTKMVHSAEYLAAPARNILAIDDQVDDITAALAFCNQCSRSSPSRN